MVIGRIGVEYLTVLKPSLVRIRFYNTVHSLSTFSNFFLIRANFERWSDRGTLTAATFRVFQKITSFERTHLSQSTFIKNRTFYAPFGPCGDNGSFYSYCLSSHTLTQTFCLIVNAFRRSYTRGINNLIIRITIVIV